MMICNPKLDKSNERRENTTLATTRKTRLVRLDIRMKYKRGDTVLLALSI